MRNYVVPPIRICRLHAFDVLQILHSKPKSESTFNLQVYLESAGASRKLAEFRRKQNIFSQGDAAGSLNHRAVFKMFSHIFFLFIHHGIVQSGIVETMRLHHNASEERSRDTWVTRLLRFGILAFNK
jgi:hypothetical protein